MSGRIVHASICALVGWAMRFMVYNTLSANRTERLSEISDKVEGDVCFLLGTQRRAYGPAAGTERGPTSIRRCTGDGDQGVP